MKTRATLGPWRTFLPGLLILVIVIATSTVVFFLDRIRRALAEGPDIVVVAEEARGLAPGAEVWVAGSPSGRVTRVWFADPEGPAVSRVVIHATLNRAAVPYLGSGVEATISSSSLLAPVVLKLTPGDSASPPFDAADTLFVAAGSTTEHVLALARSARGVIDSLVPLSRELAGRLADGPGTVAAFRADTAFAGRMRRIATRAETISVALRSETSLPARAAADSLGPAMAEMLATLRRFSDEGRAAGVSEAIVALAERMERIAANLDRLDSDLRSGRGTAGRALYDDEIERQQVAARARLDSLKSELRRKPWRWLRVKLF